jgi:hypothetical protein
VRPCRSSEQRVWLGPGKHCDRCGDAGTNSDCFADSCVKRYSVRGNSNAYTYSNGYGNYTTATSDAASASVRMVISEMGTREATRQSPTFAIMRKERFALADSWKLAVGVLLLSSISYLPSAHAQVGATGQPAPAWKPHGKEPFEKYDNPPAPPRMIQTSPRMISPHGSFISYQVDVDESGNNIVGDAANECTISVDPTNPSRMAIGWRQFDHVTSNFRQAGWGYTTDGGITWTFPGVLQPGVFRSDPVTNSDEMRNFFYLSLQSNQQLSFFCDDLWRSTNGGQSWVERSPDRGAGGGDKQWFTIDKTGGPGQGFQYQADDGINCSGSGVQFQRYGRRDLNAGSRPVASVQPTGFNTGCRRQAAGDHRLAACAP